jgi:hypothetical protein
MMPLPRLSLSLFLLLPLIASTQEAAKVDLPASSPPANRADETLVTPTKETSPVTVPDEISGRYTPLIAVEDVASNRMSLISGGLGIDAFLDDNALESSTHPVHDVQYSISPEFGVRHVGARSSWGFDYQGAATMERRFDSRNVFSHALSAEAAYRITRHVRVSFQQDFSRSSNPFRQYGTAFSEGDHTTEVNTSAVIPAATRSLLHMAGAVEWQFGPHSKLGVSVDGARVRFAKDIASATLFSTNTASVRAYLAHQLTRRQSIGISAQHQTLRTIDISSHTRTQTAQLLYVFAVSPSLSLSWYGGPQHLSTQSPVRTALFPNTDHWFPAGGASLLWRTAHLGARLAYEQRVADGGGIEPAVRLQGIDGTFSAQFSRSTRLRLTFEAANNHSLYLLDNAQNGFKTVQGGLSFERQLLPNIWGRVQYARVHLSRRDPSRIDSIIDHNRFETGVDYRFTHPWSH